MLFFHRISAKVILITLFIMGLMTVIVFTLFWYRLYSTAEELLVGQAASFTELAEHFKTAIVPMGGSDGNAGLDSAKHAAQENGLEFNIWSLNPTNPDFNPENASSAKTFRTKMMRDLMEQAKRGAGDSLSRINPDTRVIHYMKAIRLDNKCMECHSPDIANTNLHGAFEGALPTSRVKVAVFQTLKAAFLLTLPLTILIMILYVVYIKRIVTRPLKIIMNSANSIAKGDIDQSVDYRSRDEIGMVADAFREMIAYIRGAAEAAESFSQGNLNHRVTRKSDRDVLSIHLNRAMEVLDGPFQEIRTMVGEYKKGNLSARGNANQFEGSFAELIVDINRMMDAVLEPIREATVVLERIAEKDLTVRVTGDYQGDLARLKKALNKTIDNLEDSIGYFSNSVNDLLTASQQISQSSQSIAQGASEQASSFEEVSAILEEMSGMTKQVSRDAGQARSLSQTTLQSAEVGNRAVSDMTTDMGKIKQTANQTAKIVKTIDEIAFQTNLLALNAAVEAARAGEAGKGFAVVAEEVRNLAHRSAAAAKSTSELIDESITNVDQGVKAMNNVYRDFQSILHNIQSIHTLIDAVATASQEQNVGIDQVNLAVSQLNIVTQQNAASSEESAAAAGSLTKQAHDLDDIVGEFTWEGERQYRILPVETRRNRRLPSGN